MEEPASPGEHSSKCPEERLSKCIEYLANPDKYNTLDKEPGNDTKEKAEEILREILLKKGYRGEELTIRLEQMVEESFRKSLTNYGERQQLANFLHQHYNLFDGVDINILNPEGAKRMTREHVLYGLSEHVRDHCPFCLDRYQKILEEHVKKRIFNGEYKVVGDGGAEDDLDSRELFRLRVAIDSDLLEIYQD